MSETMKVASDSGLSRVVLGGTAGAAGIWATNELGTVGLVAQDGAPPYLVIYGADSAVPALALHAGEDGGATIQAPGPHGLVDARSVPLGRLLDLLKPEAV